MTEEFKFLPIPTEIYDAFGITSDSLVQAHINDNGDLIISKVTDEELEEFVCNGECDSCPVADTDCNGECLSCPCYACCDDSDYMPEDACKSHGNRRDL